MGAPRVISLYSGAGGMDLGFHQAGFDVRWAIDHDEHAIATYRANLAEHAVCGDVLAHQPPTDLDGQVDVVIGGPPCQGFSRIGRMDPRDERSRHVMHFLDVVQRARPQAFVMENVKALAESPRFEPVRRRLLGRARELGFPDARFLILNAADHGVPQARERMFLIGLRDGPPTAPDPAPRRITVRQALQTLPAYGQPGNESICRARVIPARSPVLRPTAHRGSLLFNGSGRPLLLDGVAKTLPASMGGNATPIIDQDELDHGTEPWVIAYHQRLLDGRPALKRTPRRLRRLTVQEAAALQGFPTSWRFTGPQVSQYRQIGNAVPPPLARAVAATVTQRLMAPAPTTA